jgi:cyclohexa-1,5-dienecarbonyl-CoA hydratase
VSQVAGLERREILDGAGVVLELGPPPANVIDRAAMGALSHELEIAAADRAVKVVVITGAGKHFSFGASVPEHLPGAVDDMLPAFHRLLRQMNELRLPPVVAAVRGLCLGGGLELALACDRIVATEDAGLGCPEIRLAVFPPAGSALLPLRVGAGRASSLLCSGARIDGRSAADIGLVEELIPAGADPVAAAEAWAAEQLVPLSGSSLRFARHAARWPWIDACEGILPELERSYLRALMQTDDAVEGLQAFLDKRSPEWSNR